jgi:hypothetical protein
MIQLHIFLFLTFYTLLSLNANEEKWTQKTVGLSSQDADKIINAYTKNETAPLDIHFKNDEIVKEKLGIDENIFILGFSYSYLSVNEVLSNTKGSKEEVYSSNDFELLLAKEFTLWHESTQN